MDGRSQNRRNYLILQGVASRFFARLGAALAAEGHEVKRINFHAGDWLFGPWFGTCHYRGGAADWPDFLIAKLREWQITDIVLLGDCRPLHAAAIKMANQLGVPCYVFEEGYLRPDWITLEQGGVNGHSSLPRDPEWFRKLGPDLPPWSEGKSAPIPFLEMASQDVVYNLAGLFLGFLYPGYRRHRAWNPLLEYAGWGRRLARRALFDKKRVAAGAERIAGKPYFLCPLQVEGDTSIHHHSRFKGMAEAIDHILESFARHAAGDTLLVVKEHPLDNGLRDWRNYVGRAARRLGVSERIIYLPGGDLETLVAKARGIVTVNSTVGARALVRHRPLKVLGTAIYDIPGLTDQAPLERFWTEPRRPDPALFDAFTRVLRARCLVNGNFYSRAGIELAVAGSVKRLEAFPRRLPAPRLAVAENGAPEPAAPVIADRLAVGT